MEEGNNWLKQRLVPVKGSSVVIQANGCNSRVVTTAAKPWELLSYQLLMVR